jgi:hypothetical protein
MSKNKAYRVLHGDDDASNLIEPQMNTQKQYYYIAQRIADNSLNEIKYIEKHSS